MSRDYVGKLYSLGMASDDNALIHPPKHCTVDVNRPRVIEIRDSASITAGMTIGNNVVIGTNSLINKDVPVNRVVVGNLPARREWHRLLPAEASCSTA